MDPVADLFSAIKNAIRRRMDYVDVPSSKLKEAILELLKKEGYIKDWERIEEGKRGTQYTLRVHLKYSDPKKERSVISELKRVSKPGRRIYVPKHRIPYVERGLGIAIVSTDAGLITDHEARKLGKGGELIAYVW
ncbi:MAG: 30S ribosomal protein S8 [Aquificaceae bacterium]|nr:30S ribosomal protein S8 [Aquificaceae bacterium]MCS7277223.1 30S ribosomal protein S8 [Aquificaceae bacterium]MDW8066267.1 30S ribosomal protein S8 [Aquificaceae bacterium]MDW8423265.1 30S ribosomal protein S8 [Aquificaceae bacterium]